MPRAQDHEPGKRVLRKVLRKKNKHHRIWNWPRHRAQYKHETNPSFGYTT